LRGKINGVSDPKGASAAPMPGRSRCAGRFYDNLLNAANAKLTRPLKDAFRMEGHLSSAKLERV
jgi:hypothetical protein